MSRFAPNRWTAFDSDEDSESATICEKPSRPPRPYRSLLDPLVLWGDVMDDESEEEVVPMPVSASAPARKHLPPEVVGLFDQAFSAQLEMHTNSVFDTRTMSDWDWTTFLTWIYANGWYIDRGNRQWIAAWPTTDLPSVIWRGEDPHSWEIRGDPLTSKHTPPSATLMQKPVQKTAIMQFCKSGSTCKRKDCCHVHSDTIPVLKTPCSFGVSCSKRTAKVGGTPCLHLHPDEKWTPQLVRSRPPKSK